MINKMQDIIVLCIAYAFFNISFLYIQEKMT